MRTELVGAPGASAEEMQAKWKQLGDLALGRGNVVGWCVARCLALLPFQVFLKVMHELFHPVVPYFETR
jgi:hypothetical protein